MCAFTYTWSPTVMLVQRWWSHQSNCHSRKPHVHTNLMALCFTDPELRPIKVLHCGNRDFWPFLFLWSDDLHTRTRPVFPGDVQIWSSYVKAFERETNIQTNTTENIQCTALQVVNKTQRPDLKTILLLMQVHWCFETSNISCNYSNKAVDKTMRADLTGSRRKTACSILSVTFLHHHNYSTK